VTMLADDYEYVIGGDPHRDTIDLAVLDTATGSPRAHIEASADGPGYARMLQWAERYAPGRRVWAPRTTASMPSVLRVSHGSPAASQPPSSWATRWDPGPERDSSSGACQSYQGDQRAQEPGRRRT